MALIFAGMICITILVIRHINNKNTFAKLEKKGFIYSFLSTLPIWLRLLWWLILISSIAVAAINTIRKSP